MSESSEQGWACQRDCPRCTGFRPYREVIRRSNLEGRHRDISEQLRLINTGMTHADSSIYHLFHRRGLTTSRRKFSTDWLDAAANYLCLRGGRGPSAAVLIGLFQRLLREGRLRLAIQVGWTILWLPEARR